MLKSEIYLYPTATGRTIAAKQPLTLAPDEKIVNMATVSHTNRKKILCDAPTAEMAEFLCAALLTIQKKPKCSRQDEYAPITEATKNEIVSAAKQAADMHAKCLVQEYHWPMIAPYHYIYTTNRNRYAISQHTLAHAAAYDPEMINESILSEEDLAATCFVYSFSAAAALPGTTTPIFHDANSKEIHAICNEAILGPDSQILVRNGTEYLTLATIIQKISNHKVAHMLAELYIGIFKYQSALCSIYLDYACAKSA